MRSAVSKRGKKAKIEEGVELLANNRAASHEFLLVRRIEAGLVLIGTEVKVARAGQVNLKDGYARIVKGEAWLCNVHFSPYSHAPVTEADPRRMRKLLLHAKEIRKLARDADAAGMTLVPTRLYLKRGRVKVEIALAKGKKSYDKREAGRKKEMQREMDRARSVRQ